MAVFSKICCALIAPFALLMFSSVSSSRQSNDDQKSKSPTPEQLTNSTAQTPTSATGNTNQPAKADRTPQPGSLASAWALLDQGVNSDKFQDRSDTLSALTILAHDGRAVAMIAKALDDKEEMIRVLAATLLGEIKARSTIPELRNAVDDKSPEVSFAAAQALWKMGDRSGRDIFYEVLDGERKVQPSVIKSKLHKARMDMHDPKALVVIGVNEVSSAFLGPFSMGVSMTEEYAKNTGASIQALCAQLLATDHSRGTTDELTDALGDKNWTVRAAAAKSLAKLDYRGAKPQLKDMMQNDKSQPARLAAAAAVIQLSRHTHSGGVGRPTLPVPSRSTTPEVPSTSELNKAK